MLFVLSVHTYADVCSLCAYMRIPYVNVHIFVCIYTSYHIYHASSNANKIFFKVTATEVTHYTSFLRN